jgi:hypothetical protein
MQKLLECGSPRGCAQAPAQLLAYRAKVYLADQSASYCEALNIAYVVGSIAVEMGNRWDIKIGIRPIRGVSLAIATSKNSYWQDSTAL